MPGDDSSDDNGEEEKDPVEEIFEIIDRYYKGLTREKEGMGAD